MSPLSRGVIVLVIVIAFSAPTHGQGSSPWATAGGPFSSVPLPNAPFSADAVTNFGERLRDGSVREHILTARYYRDSQGRVRAELDTPWGPYVLVRLFHRDVENVYGSEAGMQTWVVDPVKRTYQLGFLTLAQRLFNGEGRVALPLAKICFWDAPPVVASASDAERLRAINAQVSPDLAVVIASHRSDGIGSVDYALTNIRREEPPAELFVIPGYAVVTGGPIVQFSPLIMPSRCKPLLS